VREQSDHQYSCSYYTLKVSKGKGPCGPFD